MKKVKLWTRLTKMKVLIGVWIGVFLDYITTWIGVQNSFKEINPHPSPVTYGFITTLALLAFELLKTSSDKKTLEAFRVLVTSMVFYPFIHNILALNRII